MKAGKLWLKRAMMNDEVLIVGAGPAGMAAAGGQVYRAVQRVQRERPEQMQLYGPDFARGLDISHQFEQVGIEVSYATSIPEQSW
ncbi:MAG: hypothetical protein GY820_41615 [Gammaproteobacteria bacterium]|nr:hypothetical protein [Gammaproteobacteria bacterium]